MDELDSIGDAEFFSTAFRLLGEQLAHVDAGADDAVIARPGAQHLPRTAAEVEHAGPPFQAQRGAESGELFGRERVMDAVSALADVEDPWNIHCRNLLMRVNRFGHGLTTPLRGALQRAPSGGSGPIALSP